MMTIIIHFCESEVSWGFFEVDRWIDGVSTHVVAFPPGLVAGRVGARLGAGLSVVAAASGVGVGVCIG
jgi:hypothetical protein